MKNFRLLIIAIIMVFAVTACSPAAPAPEPTPEPISVTIQLSWIHEYSSSVFHTAVRNNHFAERGLNLELLEAGFDSDVIEDVLAGEADFGLSNSSSMIRARAEGKPVVAVASVLQRSPLAVISLPETGIARPQDLIDRTISVTDGGARAVYDTLLFTQDIDPSLVNTVERESFGIEPLTTGEVDGITAWIINEGVAVQEAGFEPNYLLMSDYGVDMYDFVLITTEEMIEENPDVVRKVVAALRDGIQDTVDNPAAAIKHTLSYDSELVEADQLRRLEATIPLMNVPNQQLGGMDAEVWQYSHDFLLERGILSEPVNLDEVYTLEFLTEEAAEAD